MLMLLRLLVMVMVVVLLGFVLIPLLLFNCWLLQQHWLLLIF
jgi:hypothetical protein